MAVRGAAAYSPVHRSKTYLVYTTEDLRVRFVDRTHFFGRAHPEKRAYAQPIGKVGLRLIAGWRVAGVGGTTLAVASMSYGYGPKSVIPATRLVVSHRHIWRRLLAGGTGLTPQPPRDAAQG